MAVNTDLQIDGVYYIAVTNGRMTAKTPLTKASAHGKAIAACRTAVYRLSYVFGRLRIDARRGLLRLYRTGDETFINIPRTTWTQYDGASGYKKPVKIAVRRSEAR